MKHNIYKLYIIKISKWFMLYMPIVKLFYEENGLNNFQLLTLHAVYSITIFFLEIPSGYIADVWGRKKSLILGTILGCLGFFIYSATYGFWGFFFAELALGIGQSFISGTDSAMLYDTLIDIKKENQYIKYEGKITAAGNFAEATAGIIISGMVFLGIAASEIRATVLSIRSLLLRLLYSILGPLFGWVSDTISLRVALIMCGITLSILGTTSLGLLLTTYRK